MHTLSSHNSNNEWNEFFTNGQYSIASNENEKFKMCLKGKLLKSLEHQWKQPLNYISTNLLNLEIKSELDKIEHKDIEQINQNIEKAINAISNNVSNYNKLFETTTNKTQFLLQSVITNYFNIIQHKLRNNNIELNTQTNTNNEEVELYNHENEFSLCIILILHIFVNYLLTHSQNFEDSSIDFICYEEENHKKIQIIFNANIDIQDILEKNDLEFYVLKHLLDLTQMKIDCQNRHEQTIVELLL